MICSGGSACLILKQHFNPIQTKNTGFLIKEKTLFVNLFASVCLKFMNAENLIYTAFVAGLKSEVKDY